LRPKSSVKAEDKQELPAIEPTSDAFTISVKPLESATIAMISSGARSGGAPL
jgi:hypothetical protein